MLFVKFLTSIFICFINLFSIASNNSEANTYNVDNINSLNNENIKPNFYKDNNKYYFTLSEISYNGSTYKPYVYSRNGNYYQLKEILTSPTYFNPNNLSEHYNVLYVNYPKNLKFDDNKFSYSVSSFFEYNNGPVNNEPTSYEVFNMVYDCSEYFYCLNKSKIEINYTKSITKPFESSPYVSYSYDSKKATFIKEVEEKLNKGVFVIYKNFDFTLSDYLDFSIINTYQSKYDLIPKNNCFEWYQCLIPDVNENPSNIYNEYAFDTYENAKKTAINKYYEAATYHSNSSTSKKFVGTKYEEYLTYLGNNYIDVKLYNGYNAGPTHNFDEFYLLRLPGTYYNPVAILKEWVPKDKNAEFYLKDIIEHYIENDKLIYKIDYFTPIEKRAREYEKGSIYDNDTVFLNSLELKSIKKQECNINFNYLHVDYKGISSNGDIQTVNTYINNTEVTTFSMPGYYIVESIDSNNTTNKINIFLTDDDIKSLYFDFTNSFSLDDLNKHGDAYYLDLKGNKEVKLFFPYFDSYSVKILKYNVETKYIKKIDYTDIDNLTNISFIEASLDEGSYEICIANRFGLVNKINLFISNEDTKIEVIEADNQKLSIKIDSQRGGLKNVASYIIQRAFYKKEESLNHFDEIEYLPNYKFEDVNENSEYVYYSKDSDDYTKNNIFTFTTKKENNDTYYQIIRISLKDYYNKTYNRVIKWNYVSEQKKINVVLSANQIQVDDEVKYSFFVNNEIVDLDSSDYKIETQEENVINVDYDKKLIKGINSGETLIKFTFKEDLNYENSTAFYKLSIIKKENNEINDISNSKNKPNYILIVIIASSSLLVIVLGFYLIKKKKRVKVHAK